MKKLIKLIIFLLLIIGAIKVFLNMFPKDYQTEICLSAEKYGIDNIFFTALVKTESNFKPDAVSSAGAKGLCQITSETAAWCAEKMGITEYDLFLPEDNIQMAAFYLSYLLKEFNGDYTLAAAAYNAGQGTIHSWLDNEDYSKDGKTLEKIPFPETQQYLKKIKIYSTVYDYIFKIEKGGVKIYTAFFCGDW